MKPTTSKESISSDSPNVRGLFWFCDSETLVIFVPRKFDMSRSKVSSKFTGCLPKNIACWHSFKPNTNRLNRGSAARRKGQPGCLKIWYPRNGSSLCPFSKMGHVGVSTMLAHRQYGGLVPWITNPWANYIAGIYISILKFEEEILGETGINHLSVQFFHRDLLSSLNLGHLHIPAAPNAQRNSVRLRASPLAKKTTLFSKRWPLRLRRLHRLHHEKCSI